MLFGSTGREVQHDEIVSVEDQALIIEAAMLEAMSADEMDTFLESHTDVQAAIHDEVLTERTIVRLDKKARISQAHKVAIFTIAKEKNDPEFKKLLTVWRMERYLESRLTKKYGNEGLRRAKKSVDRAGKSKSKTVKKAVSRVSSTFNGKTPTGMPQVHM